MITGQTDPTLRIVSFAVQNVDGSLASGLSFAGAEVQSSANGAALGIAGGVVVPLGNGAYGYKGTLADASTPGDFLLYVAKTGYQIAIIDEPVTAQGFSYILKGEANDALARVFFTIRDLDGNPVAGLTPTGSQVQTSSDGVSLVNAAGTVVAVGSGIYYYQTVAADRAAAGDLIVFVNVNPLLYVPVVARKLILGTNTVIVQPPVSTGTQSPQDNLIGGFDIALSGGDFGVTASGDWALVGGVDCAIQSVVREIPAVKGSFPRRPDWGGNLGAMLYKNLNKSNRDQAVAQARAALLNNPRIRKINSVDTRLNDSGTGFVLVVDADSVDGHVTSQIPFQSVRSS